VALGASFDAETVASPQQLSCAGYARNCANVDGVGEGWLTGVFIL